MKTLYIIRHADSEKKSEQEPVEMQDIKRKLTKTGNRDAKDLAKRLDDAAQFPDLIVSSPAERALETARIIAKKINYPKDDIAVEKTLYESGKLHEILTYLERQPAKVESVYIIGHNPVLSELVTILMDSFDKSIPKCGVVALEFHQDSWAHVKAGKGVIKFYDYPGCKRNLLEQMTEIIYAEIFNNLSAFFSVKSHETHKHLKDPMAKAAKALAREFQKTQKRKKDKIRKNKTWASSENIEKKEKADKKDK